MKKIILTLAYIFPCIVNAQQWEWARTVVYTSDFQSPRKTCLDGQGNVYILGYNYGWSNFTPRKEQELSPGYFIAKFSKTGDFLWSKKINGEPVGFGADLTGNLIVTGNYSENLTTLTNSFTAKGGTDFFVIKFNPSGEELWAQSYGGKGSDAVKAIAVDDPGNIHITGCFSDTIQFGSFVLQDNITEGVLFYLVKINPIGEPLWAVKEPLRFRDPQDICLDKYSNIYTITPFYLDSCDYFCNGIYFMKHDQNGNKAISTSAGWGYPESIKVDNNLNIYIFSGESANTYSGCKVIKYDPMFNSGWSAHLGEVYGTCYFYGSEAIDNSGNVYFLGKWGLGYAICDSDKIFNQTIYKKGETDLLVTKFNDTGTHLWTKNEGRKGWVSGEAFSVDKDGSCYVVGVYNVRGYYYGTYSDTVIFNSDTLTSVAQSQIFIAKLKSTNPTILSTVKSIEKNADDPFTIFPNPNTGQFTLLAKENNKASEICVYDLNGNCVHSQAVNQTSTQIDLSKAAKGIYFVEVNVDDKVYKQKLIVQ